MQTFNQSLIKLIHTGMISYETAVAYATSPEELRLAYEGMTTGTSGFWWVVRTVSPTDPVDPTDSFDSHVFLTRGAFRPMIGSTMVESSGRTNETD